MQRTFSYILLITWVFLFLGCANYPLSTSLDAQNIKISIEPDEVDSHVVEVYLLCKDIVEKDMSKVGSIAEKEMVKDKPESALTNFLADLLLEQFAKIAQANGLPIQPDISYFNYDFSDTIPADKFKRWRSFNLSGIDVGIYALGIELDKNKKENLILVNQAWWGGLVVGKIDYVFERDARSKKSTFIEKLI